jgi:hypothetical protein
MILAQLILLSLPFRVATLENALLNDSYGEM